MSTNPSPALAAFLSFIFPGIGQIYAGEIRKGLIWVLPMLLFIVAIIWLLLGGTSAMIGLVASTQSRVALLVLNFAFFLYHVAAMIDAYQIARREQMRGFGSPRAAPILLAALVAVTMVLHGVPEVIGIDVNNTLRNLIGDRPDDVLPPPPSFGPEPSAGPTLTPAPTESPTATPGTSGSPTPSGSGLPTAEPSRTPLPPIDLGDWPMAADGRLNLLLVGTDSRSETGVDDNSLRTDSMILLSVEIQSGKAAIFSFPRNMCTPSIDGSCGPVGGDSRYPDWLQLSLPPESAAAYPNGIFPDMLNALWRRAAERADRFPGSEGVGAECAQDFECSRGWRALTGTIQQLSGATIDGVIAVNLKGFVALVENLPEECPSGDARAALTNARCYGGVWLDVPTAVHDDRYHTSTQRLITVDIKKGCQFFDGEMALAYSRARHETSDYDRSRRQQYVLTQIRRQLDPLALLPHIPALLQVADQNLFMTIGESDISNLAQVASRVDADRIYRYDFAPNRIAALGSARGLRDKVQNIFSEPEPQPEPEPSGERCPPRN